MVYDKYQFKVFPNEIGKIVKYKRSPRADHTIAMYLDIKFKKSIENNFDIFSGIYHINYYLRLLRSLFLRYSYIKYNAFIAKTFNSKKNGRL